MVKSLTVGPRAERFFVNHRLPDKFAFICPKSILSCQFMPLLRCAFLLLTFIFSGVGYAAKTRVQTPCSEVQIESSEDIHLSKTERKWICGDGDSPAWKFIPPWQARFFLKSFLQQRGFHSPQFEVINDRLIVRTGEKTFLQDWKFLNEPPGFHSEKRRKLKGQPLTPKLLDEIEAWSKVRLQTLGYPCPEVTVQAVPATSSVTVQLEPGEAYLFPSTEKVTTRDSGRTISIERFAAFLPQQRFDTRLLQLTGSRMVLDEYHLSAYFETKCLPQGELQIVPRLVTGDPQLISAGAGFNTEVGAIAQVRYKHTQLDESGSSFESKLFLSFRQQTFENSFQIYNGPPYQDRSFWKPQFNIRNDIEEQYKSFTTELGVQWGFTHEFENFSSLLQLGPFYTYTNTERSDSNEIFRSVTSNAEVSLQSHDYEYYMGEPRDGWLISSALRSAYENLGADQTFHQWTYQQQNLWNLNDWEPPFLILGWRFKAGTFIMSDSSRFFSDVPDSQKFFLGGDSTLRGFSRKQIPVDGLGSATFLYQGFELRAGDIFPYKLQPFVFIDMGWESAEVFTLNRTLYYSPGIGIRWSSFIGPVRASLAQGQTLYADGVDIPPHWQAYVSLGREF